MTSVLRKLISQEDHNKIISNPYFWLTLLLVLVIAAVYYLNHIIWDERWTWFWHLSLFEFSHDINGSLMYIPFILAAILLGVRGLLIIWSTAMVLMLPVIINFTPDPQSIFTNIIFMIAPMLIIGYISLQIKWRDQERKIITEREKEKQYYLSRILKAQDDERKRIAQELHDDTTQILLVVATHVQSIISDQYFKTGSEPAERMEWIKNTVLHLSDDIRRISMELRPSILDNMEFIPALESLVESLEQNYGIESIFEVSGNERDISKECQISLIRVVQEALTNIRRHSKATKASVKLHFYEKEILLTIEDNGRGFTEDDKARSLTDTKKLGIIGMRERIGSLGGTFDIHSEAGKGTQIIIKLSQK
jgi:two-component system, NarL family, sensor histidine kinase DegS